MPPPIKFPSSAPSSATAPSSAFQPPPMKKTPPQLFTPSGIPSAPANKDQQQQHKFAPPPPPSSVSSIPPRYQIQPSLSSNATPEVSPIKSTALPNQNNYQNIQDQPKLPNNQSQQQIRNPLPNPAPAPTPPSKQAPPLPPPGSASSSANNSRNATPTNNNNNTNNNSRRPPPPAQPPSRTRSNPNSAENSRNNSPKNEKKEIVVVDNNNNNNNNETSASFTLPKKMMMPPPPKSREGSRNPTPTNINRSRSGSLILDNANINGDANKQVTTVATPTAPLVPQVKQPDPQKNPTPTPTAHKFDRSEEIEEIDHEGDQKTKKRENAVRDQTPLKPPTSAPPSALPQLQLLQIQKVENPFLQEGQGQNAESVKFQPNRQPPPSPPSQQQQQPVREIINVPTPTIYESSQQQQLQSRQEKPIQRPDALPSSEYNGMTSAPSSAKIDNNSGNNNTKNNFGPSLQDPSQKQSDKNTALPVRKSFSNPGSRTQSPDPYSNSDNRNNNQNQNNIVSNGNGAIAAARVPRDTNTTQSQQQQQQQRTSSAPSSTRVTSKTPMAMNNNTASADFPGVTAASSRGNSAVAIPTGFSSGPSSAHGCVNPPVRRATVTSVAIQTEMSWDQLMNKMKREIVDEVRRQNVGGLNPSVYVVSSREVGEQLTRLLAKDPKSIERNRKREKISSPDDRDRGGIDDEEVEYHQNLFSGNLLNMVQKNNNKNNESTNATILIDSPRNGNSNNASRNLPNSRRNQDFVTSFNSTYDMLPSVVAAATDRTVLRPVESSRRFTPTGTPVRGGGSQLFPSSSSSITKNNNNTMPQKPGVIFSSSKTFVAEKEDLMVAVNQSESNRMADKVHRSLPLGHNSIHNNNNNSGNMFLSQIFHQQHQQNSSQSGFDDRNVNNSERRARNLAIHEREKDQRVNPFLPTSEEGHLQKHHHHHHQAVSSGPFVGSHSNLVEDTKQRARDPLHSVIALEEL